MKKVHKQALVWLVICTVLGLLFGLIFGYIYNQYLEFLIIALSLSYFLWLLNFLALIFVSPKIKSLPRKKGHLLEIVVFFVITVIGFFIAITILSYIFGFSFYKGKIFLINMGLLVVLYIMISGLNFSIKFYKELKEKELVAERLKALASEAKFKALKSQIHPHFLFNTLNSVNALVIENPRQARKMVDQLSGLLRMSLDSQDKTLMPLKTELKFAHLYLEIEKVRFGNKLDYLEEVDPELLDVFFPAMVLQPLLENAVKHGIAKSRKGGAIRLAIERREDKLRIKALIIDDEALGRKIIREYLKSHPEVEVMAECEDAYQALEAIQTCPPDLLFLDVQMPEINGFEMLKMLDEIPFIIFSTAYDRYALEAFEVNAVDYLLKPFDQKRFDLALERVKIRIQQKENAENIKSLIKHIHSENPYLEKVMVKKSGKMVVLDINEIYWVEATGDYVNFHTDKSSYLVLQSLSHLQIRLNPERFVRVHRSAIVNLEAIKEIVPWSKGQWKIHLKNGQETFVSRSGAKRIKKFMI